ncbi:MAG: hypothetical protein U9R37_00260 [Campylobacterota bacterium]|nr:hypothetical protein [Campylobacterota bacterium]
MNLANCKNRIKPIQLREQKTEALLVFIRTTLEQYFQDLDTKKIHFHMGTVEDNKIVDETLKTLLNYLQETVVNSTYLRSITTTATKNQSMMMLAKKEEPLMVYYDAIIKQIELSLSQGQNWIPEQLVICLLSEWILEEEKSTVLYPFLKDIDYTSLLSRYDTVIVQAKKDEDWNKTLAVKTMYKVAHELIVKLKNTTYKVNTKRVSKSRKKKK